MIETIKNAAINESCKIYTHKSGIKIYVVEKPEFSSSYAIFGTKYGSIDTKFKIDNGEDVEVPEGIAHYLEHKLFESEEGDAFTRFSKTGAMANAFTSFDRTCYLFSCSSRFEDNFRILLDFVQHPYFTEETVRKEQGIIGQEINMYDDSASWKVLFNLLCAMYKSHPVRIDIAGTVESIAKINAELLYECYNNFYNLSNMFICVAGNVNANEVFKICDELLKNTTPVKIERNMPKESEEVVSKYVEKNLPVSLPLFAIGYKEKCDTPQKSLGDRILTEIVLKAVFGADSLLYKKLLDESLINDSFGSEYFYGYGYSSVIVEGESKEPKKVYDIINNYVDELKKHSIDEKTFSRIQKAMYASAVSNYNSVESIVMNIVDSAFMGEGVFDSIELLQSVTLEQVNKRLNEILKKEYSSISVVCNK